MGRTEPLLAASASMERRLGTLGACREVRGDCSEWEVSLHERPDRAVAVAFASLTGPLRSGDRVLLNTTAVALGLGTGGRHFVIARCPSEAAPDTAAPFPGRGAGHLLKLRYTPAQLRVCAIEEEGSPSGALMEGCGGLSGIPVIAAELHSQAGAVILAVHAAAPDVRLAVVQTDSAALPFALSRLMAALRSDGFLTTAITTGQSFGGDLEAVTLHSGLLAARAVAQADVIVVTQGPGNAGTGSRYGFSGLALAEALHACDALGGRGALAVRASSSDPRPRHAGVSHHTRTLLEVLRVPVTVPLPPEIDPRECLSEFSDPESTQCPQHTFVDADPASVMGSLEPYRALLTTMGRTLEEDPLFFRAAAAAGVWASRHALHWNRQDAEAAKKNHSTTDVTSVF